MEGLRITACFFSFVSLSLLIVALASDYWTVNLDGSSHAGLWRGCDHKTCISYGMHVGGYFHATRAFLFMGMVAGAVSFFGLCASFYHTHIGSISIKVLAVSASFVAGLCSLIAMSTFTGVFNDLILILGTWSFGWSLGVGWASFPLFLITGGLAYSAVPSTP